jgi:predicted alpha/beta hydrolase family esterase
MKRAYIVHRWDGTPKSDWYPWLKKELEKKGFKVEVPTMPNTSTPKINDWVTYLKKVVGKLDSETYFIGHSIGCQTIMRYLEKENYNGKVGKIVFVAGWFKLNNLGGEEVEAIANPWMNTSIDFNKVKQKLSKLTLFLSTNEPYGLVEKNTKRFKEKLNAKIILEKDKGHFTKDDGISELPEVINEIN